ncbi:DUF2878 domain-containing protein [Gilvimarinus japonicus]|jgi:hypothetical protein|uniref:DUF2878 domain-containing protein n=1 Tax=Gilvimarinus japonicus TaxID=1796469 RepID=A0ABV7HNF9_9GAMM
MTNRQAHIVRLITNLALFQVGWFVCLLGGSVWALPFTALALVIHAKFIQHSPREWRLLAGFALAGIIWDGLLMSVGLISFALPQDTVLIAGQFAIIPTWLICLWVLFATTVNHSLYWLAPYPWLAGLLTAFFAPASYYAGVQLSEAQLSQPYWQPLLAVACGWGVVFPLALRYCQRRCRPREETPL